MNNRGDRAMSDRITTLKALLDHCKTAGWVMVCYHDDPLDPDYAGSDPKAAYKALTDCDEMYLRIHDPLFDERVGIAYIVNEPGLPEGEQINNYGGLKLSELLD
jgi:hypothetical protein